MSNPSLTFTLWPFTHFIQYYACRWSFVNVTIPFCFSVSKVADDFYEMLTDETKNGEALMITGKERIYIPFPQMSTFFESG